MSEDESSSPNFFREDEQGDAFMIINGVEFPLIKEDGKILALTMLDPLRKEPIKIEQRKLPKTLNKWGFKITDKLSDVEKFKKVIEAVAIVSSEDDETGDRWGRKIERTGDHGYKKMGLLSWDQMRKYLAVAVKAKLISEDKVPKRLAPAPTDIGKIKEAVYNPDEGLYARLRNLEQWKETSSKITWVIMTSIVGLASTTVWHTFFK